MLRCLQREALNKQNEHIFGRGDLKPEQLFNPDDAFTARLGGIFINGDRPASVWLIAKRGLFDRGCPFCPSCFHGMAIAATPIEIEFPI